MRLHSVGSGAEMHRPVIGRITTSERPSNDERADYVLLWRNEGLPADTAGYAAITTAHPADSRQTSTPVIHSLSIAEQLCDGDVVFIAPGGFVRILYRKQSPHNFILLTEQCNSFCLMCSQPPRDINDFDRTHEHFRLIDLIDPETTELGITGGEPTLFMDDFIRLVEHCKTKLPKTALHVLSNGRLFFYRKFAAQLGRIEHPDIMLGIPLYSDVDGEHDYVVQAKGAFDETVLGLYNLEHENVPIEIRVVIHRQTYRRLPQLAEFITRNLPFAAHVALMGMEMFGFVNKNLDELWIDPYDYQDQLLEATEILSLAGLNTSIYNHQLCVLDRRLWPFARKSISDWKQIYLSECEQCQLRELCGGLFQSAAKRHSSHIKAFAQPLT